MAKIHGEFIPVTWSKAMVFTWDAPMLTVLLTCIDIYVWYIAQLHVTYGFKLLHYGNFVALSLYSILYLYTYVIRIEKCLDTYACQHKINFRYFRH